MEDLLVYISIAWFIAFVVSVAAVPAVSIWWAANRGATWKGALAISVSWLGLSALLFVAYTSSNVVAKYRANAGEPPPGATEFLFVFTHLYPVIAIGVAVYLWRRWRAA